MANSIDPDQMPHSVASDLGLHCLLKLSVLILSINIVTAFNKIPDYMKIQ